MANTRMTGTMWTYFLGLFTTLVVILCIFYFYVKTVYRYFEKRGIHYDNPTFPFGSYTPIFRMKTSLTGIFADLYAKHKSFGFVGLFSLWEKQILINDREIIKNILVKEFDSFADRGIYYNKKKEPLSAHLFALDGEMWKSLRVKLSPTFTSGKIKGMFPNIVECGKQMINRAAKLSSTNRAVDCQDLFFRYGLAIISTTAFGLDSDALSNEDSAVMMMTKRMLAPTNERLVAFFLMFNKSLAKRFNLKIVPPAVSEFFMGLVTDTVKYREDNKVTRNDYLQLLIQMRDIGVKDYKGSKTSFSLEEMAAEVFVFILAGSETTSSAVSFCLHELSLHPEIQEKVVREVDALQDITYDSINSLEYLEMVVDETLRKYPTLGFLNRECLRDYQIPGYKTVIEKGTQVFISTHGLHNDPDLFPEPERFIPERFSKENKSNIKPYSYMPFGEGPRFCIGKRFALITVKIGLAMLLRHFRVVPAGPGPQLEPRTVITTSAGGLWLTLQPRDTNLHDLEA